MTSNPSPIERAQTMSERELRVQLAALYRVVAHMRMTDLIYTHISARIPGPEHHFLINPYGMMFHEVTASSLVKIDVEGREVEGPHPDGWHVNPAGFTIHSAIHMARPDVQCVIHTHTQAGAAVSALRSGLLPISQHALKYHGHLAYHAYEGIALDLDERERLTRDLGTKKAMILRNHGLLTVGRTIPEAFDEMYFLERACQIQVSAQSMGGDLAFPAPEVCAHVAAQYDNSGYPEWVEMAWAACLRLVSTQEVSYIQ
jgi:ribulose-5-phosphate 4-epimerase/fuculose-1-phosphate aldolase